MPRPFGVGTWVHDGTLYDGLNSFDHDLAFYLDWCRRTPGRVLELCAGTGRLTIPLAQAGVEIMGLDINPSMLERARHKARHQNSPVSFIESDMRSFSLEQSFALIFVPFNSFQCIYTREDQEQVLRRVREHLLPSGRFIVEVFNPSIEMMVERHAQEVEVGRFHTDDGRHVIIHEQCTYDSASQVNRVTWRFDIDGSIIKDHLDMRCLFPQELDALLTYNGFRILHKFGDHDGSTFTSQSPKQVCVCDLGSTQQ